MRTTLIINDALFLEAKKRAAESRSNVSKVVNEALMQAFRPSRAPAADICFEMPTYRPRMSAITNTLPDEMHHLLVAEETERYRA